jgi:hypothetical protein
LKEALEQRATTFAIQHTVPQHIQEVKTRREAHVLKVMQQVKDRLTREIRYWDNRAVQLKAMEDAGKSRTNLNSANARQRADALAERLKKRMTDLELERKIVARPPTVLGGALVVPLGFFAADAEPGVLRETPPPYAVNTSRSETLAIRKVMETEKALGFDPRDVSAENRGYDIESRDPTTGGLRFIEVKGRAKGAETVTVTKNEILTGLNRPDAYILAIVLVEEGMAETPAYVRCPFTQEPDFGVASVNFKLNELLDRVTATN